MRTVAECAEESAADVGVMTTLIEARLLSGNAQLLDEMRAAVSADRIWPVQGILRGQGRRAERPASARPTTPPTTSSPTSRRARAACATSRPSPGWPSGTSARARSTSCSRTASSRSAELRKLKQAQSFLWKVRFGLHVLTGRREDRLLFDHQIKLAQSFGYEDASYTLAVEQFMQRYYRTVMDVMLLNELLLQLFREAILTETAPPRPLIAALPGAQRLPGSGQRGAVRAHAVDAARAVRGAAAEPRSEGCARLHHPRHQQESVAHRRGIPAEPAQPPPVPGNPARAGRRHPRAAPHEHLWRARPLHPGVRAHRRPHAVRPVPRLHGRRAHAVRGEQPAAPGAVEVRQRAAQALGHHAAAAQAGDRLPRGAVPRHRQGPRRRSLAARRGGCRSRSASNRACRVTTRAWCRGWC